MIETSRLRPYAASREQIETFIAAQTDDAPKADFKCQGCGACCRIRNGIVRVGDDEIRRIAAFLGMSEQEFIDRETELAPDRRGLVLKSRPDDACAYLTDDNRCRIHPVKPDKCRTFPLEWTNPDSDEVCPALSGDRSLVGRLKSNDANTEGVVCM